jgi:hypothetical protein
MLRMREMRLVSYVAALLLIAMYIAPSAGLAKGESKPPPPPPKTIVIFPFDDLAGSPVEALSEELASSIQNGLSATGSYRAYAFTERLAPIQRAVMETILKPDDLKGPFGTEKEQIESAVKIAREMAADLVLVGSIDEVTSDPANKKAEVTLSAIVADGRTGEALRTLATTGEAPANVESTSAVELVALAAGDAVAKIVKEIAPEPVEPVKPVVERKSKMSRLRKLVLPLLVGLAVGLIASSGDDGGGGDGIDIPPEPPSK